MRFRWAILPGAMPVPASEGVIVAAGPFVRSYAVNGAVMALRDGGSQISYSKSRCDEPDGHLITRSSAQGRFFDCVTR